MEYHTDYIPKADYDWSMNDLETRIIELEAWLDNVRSNMCACGNHHIDPEEHVFYCMYRVMTGYREHDNAKPR